MDQETQEEIQRLNRAVDDFAGEMKARLQEQAIKGCRGWDDPANYSRIYEMMGTCVGIVRPGSGRGEPRHDFVVLAEAAGG